MEKERTSILDIIDETVQRYSQQEAVIDPYTSLTWEQLQHEAKQIGNVILQQVRPEKSGYPVAVFSEKTVELMATVMGINYAGGFYVYINPEQPADRITKILDVLEPSLCIVSEELAERWEDMELRIPAITMEDAKQAVVVHGIKKMRQNVSRETPLYGVFTSGSTGVPKCVLVSHGAAMDFIRHFVETFEFTQEDILANQAPFDFDVSIKDIVTAYYTGAKLVLIPREYFSTPPRLLDYICDAKVTNLTWAVSALCVVSGLKGFDYRVPMTVKRVMFSGEVMPMKQLELWQQNLPDARFVNLYGPSEITCNCMYYELNRTYGSEEKLPLGQAFEGRTIYLLDENGASILGPNQPGEICVAGESLAIGYYNNEEQTRKHFVTHQTMDGSSIRLYCTGDLAEYAEDGELYFAGRKDFQIKHMGHRIELEEIERSMNAIQGVERCICNYDAKRQRITAFYTGDIDKTTLHLKMKERLPVYMVPNRFFHVVQFELNKNGKIDRGRLEVLEEVS